MGPALEFILKLKDLLTPAIQKTAGTAGNAINKIRDSFDSAVKGPRMMSASIDELRKRLDAVNQLRTKTRLADEFKAATREANRLREAIDRLDNKGKTPAWLEGMGRNLAAAVSVGAIMSFASSSVQAAANFEATNKSYEVLSGSKVRGQALSAQLFDLKQNTMLGATVYKNAQTLMGFGVGDREVVKDLRMIGDVAMGNADRMERLTLAFAQTRAAGKLMGQDLLQYINAGFNPLSVISERWKEFGLRQKVTVGQLREMMEKGQISSKAVTRAFELATSEGGKFYKMMDQLQSTTAGKIQLLKGHFAAFQISTGQALQPVANSLLEMASAALKALTAHKSVSQQVQDQIGRIKGLQLELTAANTSEERRLSILRELSDINPNITKGINAESIEYSKLADNINKVVYALGQKKIAAAIEDENASKILRYNKAQQQSAETTALVFKTLAEINPALAERTDMSLGQKQLEAIKILEDRINNGKATKVTSTTYSSYGGATTTKTTKEQELLNKIRGLTAQHNRAVSTIDQLQPDITKSQRQIAAATNAYNKMFDLSGTPAPSGATGGGGGTAASGSTDDLFTGGKASAINSGGQRSIVINIGKQIEHLDIHVMGKEEAGMEISRAVREEMVRVLHSINGNKE